MRRATNGISNAPGTRTTVMSLSATPPARNVSRQPLSRASVMAALKRLAMTPTRAGLPSFSPPMMGVGSAMAASRQVIDHFEAEAGERIVLARPAHHPHLAHAKVGQDLGAQPDGAQAVAPGRRHGLRRRGFTAPAPGLQDQVLRLELVAQNDDHAEALLCDALQGLAQRPAGRVAAG